jgi:hypothetical protein
MINPDSSYGWRENGEHVTMKDGGYRRSTVILPLAWLIRGKERVAAAEETEPSKLIEACERLERARRAHTSEVSYLSPHFVFLRKVWRSGGKSVVSDEATLEELARVRELRERAFAQLAGRGSNELWTAFRKERDRPRRMDAHDWIRRGW